MAYLFVGNKSLVPHPLRKQVPPPLWCCGVWHDNLCLQQLIKSPMQHPQKMIYTKRYVKWYLKAPPMPPNSCLAGFGMIGSWLIRSLPKCVLVGWRLAFLVQSMSLQLLAETFTFYLAGPVLPLWHHGDLGTIQGHPEKLALLLVNLSNGVGIVVIYLPEAGGHSSMLFNWKCGIEASKKQ